MSDLFKKHQPRMSDEEDRRLWQQVRVPVARSPVRTAGWRSWFALPAVRYGLPALAVVVVAVVWVVERSPVPPAREAAEQAAGRTRAAQPSDREIALPPSALHTVQAPVEERERSQFKLEANAVDKSKSSSAPPLAGAKNDAPAAGTVATRELDDAAAPAKDEDRKERDDRAGASMSEQKQAVAPTGATAQSVRPEESAQKSGGASKRVFAQAPTPAPAPAQEAAPSPSTATLGKVSTLYRANDALVDNGRAGNIVDEVLEPARYGPLFGAAHGPFADSPVRVVAAGSGAPVEVRFSAPAGSKIRHEVTGGNVQVYRVPADAVVRADLAVGAPGEGSALALDGAPVPYERAEPRLQLALVAIEFAQALEARDTTPKSRIVALRDAAVRVGARGGPGVTQGAGRLVGMIEGALTGWRAR